MEAGKENGHKKEISPLNCLPWRQFAEVALPGLFSVSETPLRENGGRGWGSSPRLERPGRHGVNEMISSAHLKWTKTSTPWTPAPFCWFWLFRSTPMALRGQQVRRIYSRLPPKRDWEVLTCGSNFSERKKRSDSGEGANFVPRFLLTRCCVYLRLAAASRDLLMMYTVFMRPAEHIHTFFNN